MTGPKTGGRSPHMASEQERLGTSTRRDLHVLCYQHHTEMLLRLLSEPAEGLPYACRRPVVLSATIAWTDTSLTQKSRRLSIRKPCLASTAPMMGNSCI